MLYVLRIVTPTEEEYEISCVPVAYRKKQSRFLW